MKSDNMSSKSYSKPELHGRSSKNTIRERVKFNSYKLDGSQTIDSHFDTLKELAVLCDFGEEEEDRIRDKILAEYNDPDILGILDHEKNVTLQRVLGVIRQKEQCNYVYEKSGSHHGTKVLSDSLVDAIVVTNEEVDMIVDSLLKDGVPNSLKKVESVLERKYNRLLSQDDKNYVEVKYTETLIELWLDEVSENIMVLANNPLELIEQLSDINSLQGCFSLGKNLPYNTLVEDLCENANYIRSEERKCVQKFKATSLSFMILKTTYLQGEINFKRSLVRILKRTKNVQELCNSFCVIEFLNSKEDEVVAFRKFLQNIISFYVLRNCTDHLKTASQAIVEQSRYFFVKDIKDSIKAYMQPAVFVPKFLDGRKLLEVQGKHIVMSRILRGLEKTQGFCKTEEVRFVNVGVIHVDEDMNNIFWHGKNIVVVAETIIVSMDRHYTWDVSGLDAKEEDMEPAGTNSNGVGLNGAEGKPGESGGNILISCDEIQNASYLKIMSNGGKGSKGQDGGNGKDGIKHDGMSVFDFKKNYPPVSKWIDERKRENLEKTKKSVMNGLESVKLSVLGSLVPVSKDDFDVILNNCIKDLSDIYFETKTKYGSQISFSFYYGQKLEFCQSFLIHKGSNGEPGKDGGTGGNGGKGGFAGDINIISENPMCMEGVVICRNKGEDGKNGEFGMCGNPGVSGLDFAYIDSTTPKVPFLNPVQFPIYFETQSHDCHRLAVKFHSEKHSKRVYCPHNGLYAEIIEVPKESQGYQMRFKFHKKSATDTHASKVFRKKTISTQSILEQYENKTSITDCDKLSSIDKKIKQMYEEISNEELLQKEQITKETRITRKIDLYSNQHDPPKLGSKSTCSSLSMNKPSNFIHRSSNDVCDSNSIVQVKMNSQELNLTCNSADIQATYLSREESMIKAQLLLSSKYQLSVLDQVEKIICNQKNYLQTSNSLVTKHKGSVDNTLILCRDHDSLSEVESYLCDDTEDKRHNLILKFDELATDTQLCMKIFNLYLESNGGFDDCEKFLFNTHLQAYKKHYNWFKHKKAKSMHTKLIPLINDISGNQEMYIKFVKAITEQNIRHKVDIEHQIRGNILLNILYEKYIEEANKPFVWKSILLSERALAAKLKEGFKFAIQEKGPSSVFYREVVAHLFKTNILIYSMNECNQMVLVYNHNPSADEVVHILMKDNQCLKLKTDLCLSDMIRAHEEKGKVCSRIERHVDSMKDGEEYKDKFDNFVNDCPFLHDGYHGIDKSTEMRLKINHMLMEDENIQYIANAFEQAEVRKLISSRLTMLKYEYIGYQSFLYYIALHMKTEGNQLLVKELCCIVNYILKSMINTSTKVNLASWIIAAYHQTYWIVEFLLIKLEIYFNQLLDSDLKNSFRKQLNEANRETVILLFDKLDGDQSLVEIDDVEEVILLISQTSDHQFGLFQLSLNEWKYCLKDLFWANKMKSIGDWSEEELKIASFYLATLENSAGKEVCLDFITGAKSCTNRITLEKDKQTVLNTLKLLSLNEPLFSGKIVQQLSHAELYTWEEVILKESFSSGEERSLHQLSELIKMTSNTSGKILANIDKIVNSVQKTNLLFKFLKNNVKGESKQEIWLSNLLEVFEEIRKLMPDMDNLAEKPEFALSDEMTSIILVMQDQLKCLRKTDNPEHTSNEFFFYNLEEILLATVCNTVFLKFNKILRNTQLLAIIIFLKTRENVLGQVSTGEGKSLIVTTLAIIKAMFGSKVDIITSSRVLAERDAKESAKLCKMFGIEVGHNCSENIEERKQIYSKCNIVYGELSYFQRDYLLDRVYNNNILGDRTFQTILIDEVDSMLLDKAGNVLYLSHDMPGLDKLEPLFVFIWKCINLPSNFNTGQFFSVDLLKEKILFEMYFQIKKEDIRSLDVSLTENDISLIWEYLKSAKVIDINGRILHDQLDGLKLDKLLNDPIYGDHMRYLLKKIINREKELEIPNHLKIFVEEHLDLWIESAINAINLKNNIDYVVDVDRSKDSSDRTPNIIIVDRDTGTDLINSQWDQGLHQFLQLKHGCRLSPLTFKAVFISNVSYLKLYKTLFGLTGTLGSRSDRDLLREVYKVEFVTIPTCKAKQFTEEMPILCNSVDKWATTIVEEVYKITKSRSALIICDSLKDVFTLKERFEVFTLKNKLMPRQIRTYTRDYEEFDIAGGIGIGEIIISTNLAGRGTDIKLSDKLVQNGGLYVCLSFLPSNCRVEEQAYGRSARNGQPGSGQLIFRDRGENNVSKIIDIKKERDKNEIFRVSDVKKYYESKIKNEEELFNEFLKKYVSLRNSSHCSEIKEILLMACLDQWAFWLEKNTLSSKSPSPNDLPIELLSDKNEDDFAQHIQDPFQLTKLGLFYLQKKENEKALKLFNRVIEMEPVFNEAAYYYRACVKTSKDEIRSTEEKTSIVQDLKIVEGKLKKRIESSLKSAHFVNFLKDFNSQNILQINSYKEQQLNVCQTNEIFLDSVMKILGYPVIPERFSGMKTSCDPEIENEIMTSIIFNDLLEEGLIKQELKTNITEQDLSFTAEFGLCPQSVKDVLLKVNEVPQTEWYRSLKKSIVLPSRELFWKELETAGILENVDEYVFVNHVKLKKIDPSLGSEIERLAIDFNLPAKNRVSLYLPEELNQLDTKLTENHSLFFKNELKRKLGETKFLFLKKQNIMFTNKHASFTNLLMKPVEFSRFDNITNEDFLKVGIPGATAAYIIENLIQERVIDVENNSNPTKYCLLISSEDLERLELKTLKGYSSDVRSLLSDCFAFRLAIQKLQQILPQCQGDYSKLFLPLQSKLHRKLWSELFERGIINRTVNHEEVKSGKLKKMYSLSMNKESYVNIFSKVYGEKKSEKIVDDLISKEWLKRSFLPHETSIDTEFFKKTFSYDGPIYTINYEQKNDGKKTTYSVPPVKLCKKPLSESFQCDMSTIELILLYHLSISENVKAIETRLECLAGSINEVDTPYLSLRSLEIELTENRIPTCEIDIFTLNGFSQIVSLEEKKYTNRMFKGLFYITMGGLAEVAVGAALSLVTGAGGAFFLTQGIDDLIFAISCAWSGHLSWKSYVSNKLVSLITSSISAIIVLRSTFAAKSAGLSSQTFKEKCMSVFSEVKTSVKNMFVQSEVSNQMTKSAIVKNVAKRVVVHGAESCAYGASFTLLDNMIQGQNEKLANYITELVHSDIDHTIANHSVFESVEELHCKLGKDKTLHIINKSLSIAASKVKSKETFNTINIMPIVTLIGRTISKDLRKPSLNEGIQILQSFTNIYKVFKEGYTQLHEISVLVSDTLQGIQQGLNDEISECKGGQRLPLTKTETDEFKNEVLCNIKFAIKEIFSEYVGAKIVSPVLQCVGTHLEKFTLNIISKTRTTFLTDDEITDINEKKKKHFQTTSKAQNEMKRQVFFDTEFDSITCEVVKARKNMMVLRHLVSQNAPMDVYCIELCCKVIPHALKQEGLDVPSLTVKVESGNVQQVFCIGDDNCNAPTLNINLNTGVISNLKNNKILITSLFNTITTSLLEHNIVNPEYRRLTAEVLQGMVVTFLDRWCESQSSSNFTGDEEQRFWSDPSPKQSSCINSECEKKTPYEHSHSGEGWIFCPRVDVDLRVKDRLINLNNIQEHISKGFETALSKINSHIHRIQSCLRSFNLILDDFTATKYKLATPPPDSLELFYCYTVQYELIVPVLLKDTNTLVDFSIVLHLENEESRIKAKTKSPLGPHILYVINPINAKFLNKRLKGHVLLNIDCIDTTYSLKDCHVAGELVTCIVPKQIESSEEIVTSVFECPTPINKTGNVVSSEFEKNEASLSGAGHGGALKESNTIIIGDSLFKYMRDYITQQNCEVSTFPHLRTNQFQRKVMSCLCNYLGVKCVVLFLGNDIIKTNISERSLVNCLFGLVEKVQENFRNIQVVICTLTYVKPPAEKFYGKISNVNTILKDYCLKNNLELLDTNRYIFPNDLGKDGIHLNRSGYHKLGKCLSEVIERMVNPT